MSDEKFLNLLSLQMAILKVNMQILACVCDKERFNEWGKCFDKIEDDFIKIVEQIKGQKNV